MPAKAKKAKTPKKREPSRFKHNPLGRPTSYSDELADHICEEMCRVPKPRSLSDICKGKNMPSISTVFRWLADERYKQFRDMYARAIEVRATILADETIDISDDSSQDWKTDPESGERYLDHEHVQRSRLRIDTRKWNASKLAPRKYGDRILQEHTGADGGPLEVHTFNIPDNGR